MNENQAASIDTPEFQALIDELGAAGYDKIQCGGDCGTYDGFVTATEALIAHIDAKLAQAREEGRRDSHETNVTMLNLKLRAEDRAIAAESRLAEIQRGVEGLKTHRRHARILVTSMMNEENFYYAGDVLALLQPQDQADASGLPG